MKAKQASLRGKLLWRTGLSMLLLWLLLAPILLLGVQKTMHNTLDNRLAASAKMVMSLMQQYDLQKPSNQSSKPPPNLLIANAELPASQACLISSINGDVIAKSDNAPAALFNNVASGYQTREYQGDSWRVFTLANGSLSITTAERMQIRDALLNKVILTASLPYLLAVLGTLLLLWVVTARQLRPLSVLSEDVGARDVNDLTPLNGQHSPAEIQPFINAINQLLQKVTKSVQRERRFIGDVAHELRTPLAGIKTQIQVAQLTHDTGAAHALLQAEKSTDRLQRTLDQLLLLSRVENEPFSQDDLLLSVGEINEMALIDVAHLARLQQVSIKVSNGVDSEVILPATLLAAALRNLLENALRYAAHGDIIMLNSQLQDGQIIWQVEDQGPGVDAALIPTLTERFVHDKTAIGSGLGLAIVQTIVDSFNGQLIIVNRAQRGLRVTLSIPANPSGSS